MYLWILMNIMVEKLALHFRLNENLFVFETLKIHWKCQTLQLISKEKHFC